MRTQFTANGYRAVVTVDWSSVSRDTSDKPERSESETARSTTRADNVENKSGMNLYRPDNEMDSGTETVVSDAYAARFRKPVLIVVAAMSGVMIP